MWTQLTTIATTSVNQNRDGFAASNVSPSMMTAVIVAMMMVAVPVLATMMWAMPAALAPATLAARVLTMGAGDDENMLYVRRLNSRECGRGPR